MYGQAKEWWEQELKSCDKAIAKYAALAELNDRHAKEMSGYGETKLEQDCLNWRKFHLEKVESITKRRNQIKDYIDGKIGLWW